MLPTNLQFAFQGGGARLALLLPVVQAIRDLESPKPAENARPGDPPPEPLIRVTHVAGTSAGAIAAVLVAARADMTALATFLHSKATGDPAAIRAVFPEIRPLTARKKLWAAWTIFWRGQPLGSEKAFKTFLEQCLDAASIRSTSTSDVLKIPCATICADLTTADPVSYSPDVPLVTRLLDSAALPFVFRNKIGKMDGGLFDNLPIDHLSSDEDAHGRRLAVAFDESAFVGGADDPVSLAASILDAAITSKTRNTRRLFGKNYVLPLSPKFSKVEGKSVDSFDIQSFIDFMTDDNAYKVRVQEAKSWIEARVREIKDTAGGDRIALSPKILGKPDETVRKLKATFDSIERISKFYHEHDNIQIEHGKFEVVAYSLRDAGRSDVVRFVDRIRVLSGSISIYVSKFFSSNTHKDPLSLSINVLDRDLRPVEFSLLEVSKPGELARAFVIVFAKPLSAGTPQELFTISLEQTVPCIMEPLVEGSDYLSIEAVQAPMADEVEICLAVPAEFGPLSVENGTADRLKALNIQIDDEADLTATLKPGEPFTPPNQSGLPDYVLYGWRARNICRREQVRVLFCRQKS